jgi:hypothetical protein
MREEGRFHSSPENEFIAFADAVWLSKLENRLVRRYTTPIHDVAALCVKTDIFVFLLIF